MTLENRLRTRRVETTRRRHKAIKSHEQETREHRTHYVTTGRINGQASMFIDVLLSMSIVESLQLGQVADSSGFSNCSPANPLPKIVSEISSR